MPVDAPFALRRLAFAALGFLGVLATARHLAYAFRAVRHGNLSVTSSCPPPGLTSFSVLVSLLLLFFAVDALERKRSTALAPILCPIEPRRLVVDPDRLVLQLKRKQAQHDF
jgi:hypothetical protein